jgi:hypothetical protein
LTLFGRRLSERGDGLGIPASENLHMCGRLRIGKDFFHAAGLVGAAMCSAFKCGSHDRWP